MRKMAIGRRMLLSFGLVLGAFTVVGISMVIALSGLKGAIASGMITSKEMVGGIDALTVCMIVLIGLTLLLGAASAIFANQGIKKILGHIYGQLDNAAGQIDGTSYEILMSSNSLAEAAARQSAALDQTSSCLEQMTAMTRTYAGNAAKTDKLIERTNETIEETAGSVEKLIESMKEMSETASQSQGIIKDIDQIAFQTNLLSINAGVEAARAGEAGLGFSVIAQEIQGLAARCAEAAKRTVDLIENTIQKVEASSIMALQTAASFTEIKNSTAEVRQYVAEIAVASREQAVGIEQTHTSMNHINQASEETAGNAVAMSQSSGELNAQGETIRKSLGRLIAFTYGQNGISNEGLASIQQELKKLAADNRIGTLDPGAHRRILKRWLEENSRRFEAIYSNTADGAFIFSEPPAGLANASVRPWWQKAIKGDTYVSPLYVSAITRKPCCTISLPVRDPQGRISGVLGADLRLGT